MKVNLTYQVEFDEVPLEVAHFVERAIRKSTELGQQIAALNYTPGSGIDFLNKVSAAREALWALEEEIEQVSTVVAGFENALLQQATEQAALEKKAAEQEEESSEEMEEDE